MTCLIEMSGESVVRSGRNRVAKLSTVKRFGRILTR